MWQVILNPPLLPRIPPFLSFIKNSGKWRLLHDLRAINKTVIPMGSLQLGLPSPVAIPPGFFKIVLDLRDCFFSIPLHPADCERFAFSLTVVNCASPSPCYQWKVLPQGMANSPTLCQKFVAQIVDPFRSAFPDFYIIHYMDDILVAAVHEQPLQDMCSQLITVLHDRGFTISSEKIQVHTPQLFLGFELYPTKVQT